MPSEAYIGRVGGLVVAVGVGAAIVTGWNSSLAWADEPGGTTESSTSSAGSETPQARGSTSGEADSSGTTTATGTSTASTTGTTGTKTKDGAVRLVPPRVVVRTGGRTEDDPAPTTMTAQPNETAAPRPTGTAKNPVSKLTTEEKTNPAAARPTKT